MRWITCGCTLNKRSSWNMLAAMCTTCHSSSASVVKDTYKCTNGAADHCRCLGSNPLTYITHTCCTRVRKAQSAKPCAKAQHFRIRPPRRSTPGQGSPNHSLQNRLAAQAGSFLLCWRRSVAMGSHRILFAALGLLLVSPCLGLAEVVFFEEFGPGWDGRWVYSSDEKYSGRFETETPAGLDGPALKVRRLIAADFIAQIAAPRRWARRRPCAAVLRRSLPCSGLWTGAAQMQEAGPIAHGSMDCTFWPDPSPEPARRRPQVPEKAKHYGLTTKLPTEVDPADGLVLQYELKLSEGLTCGGAYLKFLTATPDFDPADLTDGTPYSIMFGPDKCGSTNKARARSPMSRMCACRLDRL